MTPDPKHPSSKMKGMDRKQSKVVSKTSTSSAGNFPRAGLTKGTLMEMLSKSLGLLILTSLDRFHSKLHLLVFNWLYKTGFYHRDGKRKVPAGTPQKEITIGTATRLLPVK